MPLAYGLIHPVDIALQDLPSSLQGIRIAHLSDLHICRHTARHDRLISQLSSLRFDMVLLTGDYMSRRQDHAEAAAVLRRIVKAVRPRFGTFGVFGNHDSYELKEGVKDIGIHWLGTGMHRIKDAPIHLCGVDPLHDDAEDGAAMLLNGEPAPGTPAPAPGSTAPGSSGAPGCLRLMLAHYPSWISTAADLGVHLLFAGHTHGGQIRLPNGQPLMNACDLPLNMSCGVIRHRDTLAAISRGLGEVGFPILTRFRAFCPPHVPVYTLRRGPTLGQNTPGLVKVLRW
jgi:uncharacterized protein